MAKKNYTSNVTPYKAPPATEYKISTSNLNVKGTVPLRRRGEPETKPDTRPVVMFHPKAWGQIQVAIAHCGGDRNEVGWFTPVEKREAVDGKSILFIPEIFIPEQEVHGTETDSADLDTVLVEHLEAGYQPNILRGWFHLHPGNMGVSPSGQDERQVEEYLDDCDTLLRGIFNNKGDVKLDYYDTDAEVAYPNLDYNVDWNATEGAAETLVAITERVKRRTYSTVGTYNAGVNAYSYGGAAGNVKKLDAAARQADMLDDEWQNTLLDSAAAALVDEAEGGQVVTHFPICDFLEDGKEYALTVTMDGIDGNGEDALVYADYKLPKESFSLMEAFEEGMVPINDIRALLARLVEDNVMAADDTLVMFPKFTEILAAHLGLSLQTESAIEAYLDALVKPDVVVEEEVQESPVTNVH